VKQIIGADQPIRFCAVTKIHYYSINQSRGCYWG